MSATGFFAWPAALPILVLAPIVGLALLVLDRRRERRLAALLGPRAPVLAAELSLGQRRLRRWLSAGGLLLALTAVLEPRWGESGPSVGPRGVDILVCLDVSRSMLARDLAPDRLTNARNEIRALAERIRGDRLGLVTFAGEARLASPLTQDIDSFAELVDLIDPLSVRRGGTDVGAALEAALAALQSRTGDHGVVLLLSDGEDLEQRGRRVAEECRKRQVVVHCIGFGSTPGSKIPVAGASGEAYLLDRAGQEVVTAMDSAALRQIAETTGGDWLEASARARPLVTVYESRILPRARQSVEAEERRTWQNRFQWPLLAAAVLWLCELCLTDRRRR